MKFDLTAPCKDCPFRTDIPSQEGWLGYERAEGITEAILDRDGALPCHKTTHLCDSEQQHCAGALIMCEANDKPNQLMRIAERVGLYDHTKLKKDSPVFTDSEDFAEWHR